MSVKLNVLSEFEQVAKEQDKILAPLSDDVISVKLNVLSQFEQVAKEQDKILAPLSDDLVLLESGLDSLCFAIIVARLEDTLGVDPFSTAEDATFPVTLGDFVRFYQDAAK